MLTGADWRLLVISKRTLLGHLPGGHEVYRIDRVTVLTLSSNESPEFELDVSKLTSIQTESSWFATSSNSLSKFIALSTRLRLLKVYVTFHLYCHENEINPIIHTFFKERSVTFLSVCHFDSQSSTFKLMWSKMPWQHYRQRLGRFQTLRWRDYRCIIWVVVRPVCPNNDQHLIFPCNIST